MKLNASKIKPDYVALAFMAENQAEYHQMEALLTQLLRHEADVFEWDNMEGARGFTVRVRCAPTKSDTNK